MPLHNNENDAAASLDNFDAGDVAISAKNDVSTLKKLQSFANNLLRYTTYLMVQAEEKESEEEEGDVKMEAIVKSEDTDDDEDEEPMPPAYEEDDDSSPDTPSLRQAAPSLAENDNPRLVLPVGNHKRDQKIIGETWKVV